MAALSERISRRTGSIWKVTGFQYFLPENPYEIATGTFLKHPLRCKPPAPNPVHLPLIRRGINPAHRQRPLVERLL